MPPTTSSKKTISGEAWESKLSQVKVSKEDMNRLVMNFLVTEVSSSSNNNNSSSKGPTRPLPHPQHHQATKAHPPSPADLPPLLCLPLTPLLSGLR